MKKAFTYIKNGSFSGELLFVCGYEYHELIEKLLNEPPYYLDTVIKEARFIEENENGTFQIMTEGKHSAYLILIKSFDGSSFDISTIAHEVVHLCQFTFEACGVNREKEIEAEAYHHDFILRECLNALTPK